MYALCETKPSLGEIVNCSDHFRPLQVTNAPDHIATTRVRSTSILTNWLLSTGNQPCDAILRRYL